MADQPVTTSIDTLIKYINEAGEMDSFTLAHKLGVSEETVKGWGDILEKAGMIKISYKVGKMYLSPASKTGTTASDIKMSKAVDDVRKLDIQTQTDIQSMMINNISTKIDSYSKTAAEADRIFREKRKDTKEALDRIMQMEDEVNRTFNSINSKREAVNKYVEELKKQFEALKTGSSNVTSFSLDSSGAKALIEDINRKADTFKSNMIELRKEFESGIIEYRKTVQAMEEHAQQEVRALHEIAAKEADELSRYEKQIAKYKRKEAEMKHKADRASKLVLDDAVKSRDEVAKLYTIAEKEAKDASVAINSIKAGWGELATFNDKLSEIKKGVGEVQKENDALKQELESIKAELRRLNANKTIRPGEANSRLDTLTKRSKATLDRLTKNDKKRENVENQLSELGK